jgi:hypothetical protein
MMQEGTCFVTEDQNPAANQTPPEAGSAPVQEHTKAEEVTREQNGQFIEESSGIERVVVPNRQSTGGNLKGADLDSIRAKNVTMDRSGAEQIDAETVNMTNAGAKTIRSSTIDMQNSGSMTVTGDKVSMNQSSAMVVAGQAIDLTQSAAFSIQSESVTLHDGGRVGILVAGKVQTEKELSVLLGVVGKVEGGSVRVAVSPPAALAFGAGMAVVLTMLRRMFGRKS